MPKELLAISLVRPGISPENHTYESATEDILRAMLCTRVYTSVYPRVHFSLLGSRYMLAKSTPRG